MSFVNQMESVRYVVSNQRKPSQQIFFVVRGADVEIGYMNSISFAQPETVDKVVDPELLEFNECYASKVSKNNGQKPQISVHELRHIIPLLIMQLFGDRADYCKSKGMYQTAPVGWPSGVPFCDPNNSDGSCGKPKKEKLLPMFDFLIVEFNKDIVQSPNADERLLNMVHTILLAHDSAVSCSQEEESKSTTPRRRPSSEPSEQSGSKRLKKVATPSLAFAQASTSGSVSPAAFHPAEPTATHISGEDIQAPELLSQIEEVQEENGRDLRRCRESESKKSTEVQDDDEEVVNLFADIRERNDHKLRNIQAKKLIPWSDWEYLNSVNDELMKTRDICLGSDEEEKVKVLEKEHDFSLMLDVCLTLRHLPEKYRAMKSDTQGFAPPTTEPPTIEGLMLDLLELKLANSSSKIVSEGNLICDPCNHKDPIEDVDQFFHLDNTVGPSQMKIDDEIDPQMTVDISVTDCLCDTPMAVPIPATAERKVAPVLVQASKLKGRMPAGKRVEFAFVFDTGAMATEK